MAERAGFEPAKELPLYTGASGTHYLTRLHTSYADILIFTKNKSLKDSSI